MSTYPAGVANWRRKYHTGDDACPDRACPYLLAANAIQGGNLEWTPASDTLESWCGGQAVPVSE